MSLRNSVARLLHDPELPVWFAPEYRLPITSLEGDRGVEPRRAELAAWALLDLRAIRPEQLRTPVRVGYEDLSRVHSAEHLDGLGRVETLARIFAAPEWDVPVDEVMQTVRLATGATLGATRVALSRKGPALNLLGGFHHAGPAFAGGMCPVNDIAVALAAVRARGFTGQCVVLDLDAHPPDGTAACLAADPRAWIGSISGVDWGVRGERLVERILPGGKDEEVLAALDELVEQMPRPDLAFVIAGGDVLVGDRLGQMGMSVEGVRRRDLAMARALRGCASVWLPGGGYGEAAWTLLAGTGLALALGSRQPVPAELDPLARRFASISLSLDPKRLKSEKDDAPWLTEADLGRLAGPHSSAPVRLLGHYTAEGIEYGLHTFGLLTAVTRMGYENLRVEVTRVPLGDRMRLLGEAEGVEHVLVEGVYERQELRGPNGEGPAPILFVHWLTLRHPRGRFAPERPQLPGQDVPGLGMAREASLMLERMAARLELAGVGHRPSWYHIAFATRHGFRFVDPAVQGRFQALNRDLAGVPLLERTHAVAEGRVTLDGQPWTWEPALMVCWRGPAPWPEDVEAVAAASSGHFALVPQTS